MMVFVYSADVIVTLCSFLVAVSDSDGPPC